MSALTKFTPEEALDLLKVAEDSLGLYQKPWLDSIFSQLYCLTLNAGWRIKGTEDLELFNSDKVQNMLNRIRNNEDYRTPTGFKRFTKNGKLSRRWYQQSRIKKFGSKPS